MRIPLMLLITLGCTPKAPPVSVGSGAAGTPCAEAFDDIVGAGWSLEDPSISRTHFEVAAERCPDAELRQRLLCHAARADAISGDPTGAIARLDALGTMSGAAQWTSDLERARALRMLGSEETARELLETAFAASESLGPTQLRVELANLRALTAASTEERLDWLMRTIELAEGDPSTAMRAWGSALHSTVAGTLHDLGRLDEALEHWRAAMDTLDVESEGERARLGTERSRTLRALESFEEALALDLELLVLAKDRRLPTGWIHLELAECYRATGRWTQARRHFTRARDELEGDPTLSASERQRIAALAASEDGKTPDGTPP